MIFLGIANSDKIPQRDKRENQALLISLLHSLPNPHCITHVFQRQVYHTSLLLILLLLPPPQRATPTMNFPKRRYGLLIGVVCCCILSPSSWSLLGCLPPFAMYWVWRVCVVSKPNGVFKLVWRLWQGAQKTWTPFRRSYQKIFPGWITRPNRLLFWITLHVHKLRTVHIP